MDDARRGHQGSLHTGDRIEDKLLAWYDSNKRRLPWRDLSEKQAQARCYAIWVSEVMLQQTRVSVVLSYYERWMERFPTLEILASATEQEALAAWQGLGYYGRCRMLLNGARSVINKEMPRDPEGWRRVPGVGRYTANAICSIAFQERVPVVDGNVERVFARLTGCRTMKPALTALAWLWAEEHLSNSRPGDWNQALMELGATVCTPSSPNCEQCPLRAGCRGLALGVATQLPVPMPKKSVVHLDWIIVISKFNGKFGVRQVSAGEWWEGMWEFPRQDSRVPHALCGSAHLGVVNHSVTHHRIKASVWYSELQCDEQVVWLTPEELEDLPMPSIQRKAWALLNQSSHA